MTSIVIHDVRDRSELVAAIALVLDVMNDDAAYRVPKQVFSRTPQPVDPAPPVVDDMPAAPQPYVPCPRRGTHAVLTECWLCWNDVVQGYALEPEVLVAGSTPALRDERVR
jgi:hypothetical protein